MAATVGDQEPSPASFDSSSIMSDDSCFNMDPGITAGIRKRESLDTHNHNKTSYEVKRYKSRMIHSKHKLENFFGQSIPIDVNIAEIETHGLKAMLQSKVPLCYFLYSMLEELCSENLFFFLEAEQFENARFESKRTMKKIAISLHNTFIRKDSEFEVNIEAAIRAPILDLVEQNDQRCFSDAKEHILKLMEPLFAKFKSSFIFEKMKKELGYTSIYDKNARNSGVRLLLRNLDKTLPTNRSKFPQSSHNAHNIPKQNTTQTRNDMIRAMLHAFCEIRLGVDFIDRNYSISDNSESTCAAKGTPQAANAQSNDIDVIDFGSEDDDELDPFEAYLSTLKE